MKIGLDAGHGLKTAGKQTPDSIKEWTLNDKVRDLVVEQLKDYDVEIIFTDNDEGNIDESLTERRTTYVNVNVDAFVSIHHNAYTGNWNDATGVEVYTDRNFTNADDKLAHLIYKNLPNYTGLKGRGIKRSNWTVINQNRVPAVLVEGGFMDSDNDYKVITSEQGQLGYAKAIAEGLIEFLGLTKKVIAPQETKPIAPQEKINSYTVKVTADVLNVRAGAGTNFAVNTTIKKGEVYTIVAEENGWGKLKSGAGWIKLSYTTKTTATVWKKPTVEYYPACSSKHTSIVNALKSIGVDSSPENRKKIAIKNKVYDYEGSSKQNNQLLSKLKAGKLIKA